MATRGADPTRDPLTRERVLRAAIELADADGLGGLSMRKLATHLGFEVMSLYNHVANKRDLLEGMLDEIHGAVDLPEASIGADQWKVGLRLIAVSTHRLLLRHRWAGPIATHHFPGPNRWRIIERTLEMLAIGGFDGHPRDVGFHAVTLHVGGFTSQQIAFNVPDDDAAEMFARVDREFDPVVYPYMADHLRYHREPHLTPGERPDEFEFVLDLILDGLERTRDAGQ